MNISFKITVLNCELTEQKILAILNEEAKLDCDFIDDDKSFKMYSIDPLIKGGKNYSAYIKLGKTPKFDIIYIGAGINYKGYYSHCIRSLLINPSDVVKHNYNFLKSVQAVVVDNLRDGVELNQVYDLAVLFAKEKNESLAKHLIEFFGFVLYPMQRSGIFIDAKSKFRAVCGMTFAIYMALVKLQEGEIVYNLNISDTVIVKKSEPSQILTNIPEFQTSNVIRFIRDI